MAIDDLGLDLGNLDDLPDIDDATAIATGTHEEVTQIAQRDDSDEVLPRCDDDDDEGTALMPVGETGATADDAEARIRRDRPRYRRRRGGDDRRPRATRSRTEQMPQLSQLEPVTMSEVGTKLDLARAYMDMGDPDGARNILQEVLAEGSASQKQEARRLIDSLPGA